MCWPTSPWGILRGGSGTIVAVMMSAVGYVIGSIPFALLLAWGLRGTDVRYVGSGNVGAANVLRTTGLSVALIVMMLDMCKGATAVLLAGRMGADQATQAMVGAAAVVGHVFPVWLRFRGGKGVATACGAFAVLAPRATVVAAVVFALAVWITRYVSLGSILAALGLPLLAYFTRAAQPVVVAAIGVAMLVLYRHRANFSRLQSGRERRIDQGV